jgi:hypothetical protein
MFTTSNYRKAYIATKQEPKHAHHVLLAIHELVSSYGRAHGIGENDVETFFAALQLQAFQNDPSQLAQQVSDSLCLTLWLS